jgi:hypothetical protein
LEHPQRRRRNDDHTEAVRRSAVARAGITLRIVRIRARVRGYERGEEIITCGYAFPPRDILFAVRECPDHKPKRECSGAKIAHEGAVSLPPSEGQRISAPRLPHARLVGRDMKVRLNPGAKASGLVLLF